MADANSEGHFQRLLRLLEQEPRREVWAYLNLVTPRLRDLGCPPDLSDRGVWQKCQQEQLVLVTANRNESGPDSLESTIRQRNTPQSLPVSTLANPDRILHDRNYAEEAADQLLEYLFDIEKYRRTGRLYVP